MNLSRHRWSAAILLSGLSAYLGCSTPGFAEPRPAPRAAIVHVQLEAGKPSYRLPPSEIRLLAHPLGNNGTAKVHTALMSIEPGAKLPKTNLALLSGIAWEISIEAPGLWAAKAVFFLEPSGESIRLRVWPTATVTSVLQLPAKEKPPANFHMRFVEAPKPLFGQLASRREPPGFQGESRCVLEKTEIHCTVPAGRSDFSIHAPGFVAHYFWDVEMKPGITRVLPPLRLRPGASVSGWVQLADGAGKIEEVTVELGPRMAASDLDFESQIRARQHVRTARPNERGFYHFDGIPPGGYSVAARLANYADAGPFHFEIARGLETRVEEPLLLAPPEQLEILLTPPLAPEGSPWQIKFAEVGRIPGTFEAARETTVSPEGWARLDLLRPGRYMIIVEGRDGQQWYAEQIEITTNPSPLNVILDVETVRGEVTLGDEPLAATLWFGGRFGATKIRLTSGADGVFSGSLPKKNSWLVDVTATAPPLTRAISDVEVRRLPGESVAQVEIALPATRVFGRVIDEKGEPVEVALVRAGVLDHQAPARLSTVVVGKKDEGRFELWGFPKGSIFLVAEAEENRQSDQMTVDIREAGEGQEVSLVVRANRQVLGRVVAGGGSPVPGVAVEVTPLGGSLAVGSTLASRFDGTFPIAAPPSAREAMITLFPPGFALRTVIIPLGEESAKEIELRVQQLGGTLELTLPSFSATERAAIGAALFNDQGATLSRQQLASWAAMNGEPAQNLERLRVPNVEEGYYSWCLVPAAEQVSARPRTVTRQRCASGYLAPLGFLELSLVDEK